ncbi:polyphosphate polymerase domain-containing protein [Bacteroidales bacterium OttesenSCG-928-J19]|nr:polyphosphate polymerase domain-containing protein [Bacteroidales bacterium OttesenSCG-928-J19]
MKTTILPLLEEMMPITLEEMNSIHLMDRVDSKFVAPAAILPLLFKEMTPFFKVQVNDAGKRIAPYTTQYLDTSQLDMFVMHQNGKLNRQKIRIRTYQDVDVSFLEVKNKNNKGRTKKIRVSTDRSHIETMADLEDKHPFLIENSLFDIRELTPSLANEFNRITLVNNRKTERITIDLSLTFHNYRTQEHRLMDDLVILELKQDGWQRSDFLNILAKLRIKRSAFSKYCMGMIATDPNVKYNRFKTRWALIKKKNQLIYNYNFQ